MDNTNHRYTQRRPALRRRIACVLCWILLFQGYPLLALRESGGGFYLRDLSGVIDGDLLDWELPELPDVRWPANEDSGSEAAGSPSSTEPEEPHQVALLGGALVARGMSQLGWGYFGVPQASAHPQTPPSPPSHRDQESQIPPFDPEKAAKAFESPLDGISLVPGWNLVSLPEEPADTDPGAVLNAIGGVYDAVYAYDACDPADPWKLHDPDQPATSDLTSIDPKIGLWLDATQTVELPSDGTLAPSTTIPLCTGWNLVGFPAGQPRHVLNALAPIAGKFLRVFGFDASDVEDPWEVFDVNVPDWANDLQMMQPGRGYWVLVTEDTTLEMANEGPPPEVSITVPEDLAVITEPTAVVGTVRSTLLDNWTLSHRLIGETDWIELASKAYPVENAELATFDPTLLLNGLYEIRLQASDFQGQVVEESIAVSVEGNMKIGNFTLSFIDLAIPLSGLDIEVIRTYDSRDKRPGDFGVGWTLEVRRGSYRNNRPPGDGWLFQTGFLPCDTIAEAKSHLTTIRLSDQEIYRFALRLDDGAPTAGGCFAQASFVYVDGPLPGSTLDILDGTEVFFANGSDRVVDPSTQETYVPQNVRLTTRDGRIFHLSLENGVTHVEDLNGNTLEITDSGITHSSGRGVEFVRDAKGRITNIIDPLNRENVYAYDADNDLVSMTDRSGSTTRFTYGPDHFLGDVTNALGVRAVRTEYDAAGRMIRMTDGSGKTVRFDHDIEARREVITNRLGFIRVLEYDNRGNVVRETDEANHSTLRTFDMRNNLLTQTNPLGRTTTSTYTPENDLATLKDPLGNVTSYTYDQRGRVLTVTDPRGGVTSNVYDSRGNLIETTDAQDGVTGFTFDARGNLLTVTDALNSVTSFEHDAFGNRTKEIDAFGNETLATYDANGNRLTETRTRTLKPGSTETLVTTFAYDALGRVTITTAADGSTTSVAYDLRAKVTRRTDQLGRVTAMTYDETGRLVRTDYPDGTSESRSYDAEGRLVAQVDRAGRVTAFTWDPVGALLTTVFPDRATTSNVYDAAGRLVATTDTRGNTTTYVYDAAGRRTAVVDPLTNTRTVTFDAAGNQTSITDARGNTTSFTYDALNRLTKTTFPDGTTAAIGYDPLGRRTSETDQAGLTTHFGYDALDRLVSVTDALGQVTSYAYDEVGDRVLQTDANGHTTRFEYDALGRQTRRILPDGSAESMVYNADGTMASHTDFSGATRSFEYDADQRLTRRIYPDGSEVTFAYTPTGRRAAVTDGRGTTTYAYDARDRLLEKTEPTGYNLSYAYDAEGNRTSLTATVGAQVFTTINTYDVLNRLASVTDAQGEITSQTYAANGNRATREFPNGVVTTYAYDDLDRLKNLTTESSASEIIQSYAYTLGPAGNRIRIAEHDGTSRYYTYDALYRLTEDKVTDSANALVYQKNFSYDPVGNRLDQTTMDDSGSTSSGSSYDSRDRLLTAGAITYTWNNNGNLTGQTDAAVTSYGWDFENRLISVALPDGTLVQTNYDADGNRIRTHLAPPSEPITMVDYLADTTGFLSHVLADIVDGEIETLYTRIADQLISLYPLAPATKRYYHSDGLGSVRAMSDGFETVTDRYSYTAFGELFEHAGKAVNTYMFAGEQLDPNVGFYYLRARWMDPGMGRFASMDPFGGTSCDPASLHRYSYCSADPVNCLDPSGEQTQVASQLAALNVLGTLALISVVAITGLDVRLSKPRCRQCIPLLGTPAYLGPHFHGHEPFPPGVPHYHLFEMHQSPFPMCKCFWVKDPQAVAVPPPGVPPIVPAAGGGPEL